MARIHKISQIFNFSLLFIVILLVFTNLVSANEELNEDNWNKMLKGEWFVKFYAPWCPACNSLKDRWEELSAVLKSKEMPVNIGSVDITTSPGLSGRFVITSLPTILHVKDGEFGQYRGPLNVEYMVRHLQFDGYQYTEHLSPWRAPNSIQMTLVAHLFKLSQILRGWHETLTKHYGLPIWVAHTFFAAGTVIIGILLGFVAVFAIDAFSSIYIHIPTHKLIFRRADVDKRKKTDERNDQETVNDDDIEDDTQNVNSNEGDNPPGEGTSATGSGDTPTRVKKSALEARDEGHGELRKRRPRKAD